MLPDAHLGRSCRAPNGFGLIIFDVDDDFGFEVEGVKGFGFVFGKVWFHPSIQIIKLLVSHLLFLVLFVVRDQNFKLFPVFVDLLK